MADARKLEEDQLVQKLVPDPSQGPPNATVLRGYLGRGTDKGSWRLYLSADLDEYVELSEADILHTQKLPDDQGTLVWVPKTLALNHVRVQSEEVQADFLRGHIELTGLQPGAAAAGIAQEVPPTLATVCSTVACPPSVRCLSHTPCPSVPCHTVVFRCPPSHPPCPSIPCKILSHTPCPSFPCVSYTTPCTSFGHCPSHLGLCRSETVVCSPLGPILQPSVTVCATPTATPSQFVPCSTWVCPVGPDPDDSEQ
jgi:hypothetical protein